MEKRTLIAIVLSILVLVVFSYLMPQKPARKPVVPAEEVELEQKKEPEPPAQEEIAIPVPAPEIVSKERAIRVENNLFSAVFTTRGGTIQQWELKKYPDQDELVGLVPPGPVIPPVTIIPVGQLGASPPERNFLVDTEEDSITLKAADKKSLSFLFSDPSGLTIKKTYTFYRDSYRVDVTTDVRGIESYYVVLGSDFGVFDEKGTWVHIGPVLFKDNNKIDIDTKNIEGIGFIKKMTGTKSRDEVMHQGNIKWIAQEDKYFTSALIAAEEQYDVRIWKRKFNGGGKKHNVEIAFKVEVFSPLLHVRFSGF
jgi:YidC/Oxa1 family membrane protein insertase